MEEYDVVVLGAGNAALCAALSSAQAGVRTLVLERAPESERGGNSRYASGAFRLAYEGADDLRRLMPDLTDSEVERTDFGAYTAATYYDDLTRMSYYRADAELVDAFVSRSLETALWMRDNGVRFIPLYGRQAFKVDGRFKFWGGLTVETVGGGRGLVDSLFDGLLRHGVSVRYGVRGVSLTFSNGTVDGIEVIEKGVKSRIATRAVVLASGGFHANTEWRARYLGPGWDLAKPRASRFNTGDGIQMALEAGAMSFGHWSGCHAVAYDRNAPDFGDPDLIGQQKNGFPMGIIVNNRGRRFFNEGADFRNYIYATLGREILAQPGGLAWQVFDQQVVPLLSEQYRIKQITKVEAGTIEELADLMEGVDRQGFIEEVQAYNSAVRRDVPFNPNVRDGRSTEGLAVPKSNWANALEKPPFVAFGVTCGVTFTYGGLRIDTQARVINVEGDPIRGVYAAGELVGGLYYVNYPGGAGLMSGSVFGRIAGRCAALHARAY